MSDSRAFINTGLNDYILISCSSFYDILDLFYLFYFHSDKRENATKIPLGGVTLNDGCN